jgi:hypothetical protein
MREEFDLQVKQSKDDLAVPVVNEVYLHSMYQPINEASAFAEGYREQLKKKNVVLMLGLGFCYHIQAIIEVLKQYHADYTIMVIEPCGELYSAVRERKLIPDSVIVMNPESPTELYNNEMFVNFLLESPLIIKHDPSFNLHFDYFKRTLSYKSSTQMKDNYSLIKDNCKHFFDEEFEGSWDDFVNTRSTDNNNNIIFALNELVSEQGA